MRPIRPGSSYTLKGNDKLTKNDQLSDLLQSFIHQYPESKTARKTFIKATREQR